LDLIYIEFFKMKKIALFVTIILFSLTGCDSDTYEDLQEHTVIVGKVTYTAQVKAIIDANCISCHSAAGSASFRPMTTYPEVKAAFETTNLVSRIQRQNGESGQMPQTGRMPQDKINTIIQWGTDGLLEN